MTDSPSSFDSPENIVPADLTIVDEVVDVIRRAGEITLRYFAEPSLVVDHKTDGSPVTEGDRAAERFIRNHLSKLHPDDSIVGEEEDEVVGTSQRRWYIDPIDGTKAFIRGVPLYTNLIAVMDVHGSLAAAINIPALHQTVYAGRGYGCFCNGKQARVSECDDISQACLTTCGYDNWPQEMLNNVCQLGLTSSLEMRTWGDGYGYAMVATGRADIMVDPAVAVWDLAPMPLILAEAGGMFTDLTGNPTFTNGSGLATNGLLHNQVLNLLH